MDGQFIEIDGEAFDLGDSEDKKRAIRAWLKAKARERGRESEAGGIAVEPVKEKGANNNEENGA